MLLFNLPYVLSFWELSFPDSVSNSGETVSQGPHLPFFSSGHVILYWSIRAPTLLDIFIHKLVYDPRESHNTC